MIKFTNEEMGAWKGVQSWRLPPQNIEDIQDLIGILQDFQKKIESRIALLKGMEKKFHEQ
jgi:hypothetical protein